MPFIDTTYSFIKQTYYTIDYRHFQPHNRVKTCYSKQKSSKKKPKTVSINNEFVLGGGS